MKTWTIFLLLATVCGPNVSLAEGPKPKEEPTAEETTQEFSKAQLSVELLGAGALYSVYGSYRLAEHFAANLGGTYFSSNDSYSSYEIFEIPFSFSYLSGEHNSHFEALGGFDWFHYTNKSGLNGEEQKFVNSDLGLIPEFGMGYRYWPRDGGFHFRALAYAIVSTKVLPWVGLSFGYAFRP